jgi:WD40-like Beta Propeller Repeat
MTTYTWEYGSLDTGLQFSITYDDEAEQFTVTGVTGSFDLNALWFSNDDTTSDGYVLVKSDNNLNMNGDNTVWEDGISSDQTIVWDAYLALSSPGGVEVETKDTFISEGETQTFTLADFGFNPDTFVFDPESYGTLGVRATSVNGTGTIKWVDATPEEGDVVFPPPGFLQITNTPDRDESLSDLTRCGTFERVAFSVPGATGLDVKAVSYSPTDPLPGGIVTGISTDVNVGIGDQTDPHVDCNIAAYTSTESGVSEIRYFDFFTNTDQIVPTIGPAILADVSAGRIVYTQSDDSSEIGEIGVFNTADASTLIIPGGIERTDPSIGGSTVAFDDQGLTLDGTSDSEILVYDLATATTTRLTNDALNDINPEVSADGSVIVFQKTALTGTDSDIYVAVRTSTGWTTSAIAATPGEEVDPTTNGSLVAYASDADGDFDIYVKDLAGNTVTHFDLPGTQQNPSFSGGHIAFETNEVGGQFDIWVADALHPDFIV